MIEYIILRLALECRIMMLHKAANGDTQEKHQTKCYEPTCPYEPLVYMSSLILMI